MKVSLDYLTSYTERLGPLCQNQIYQVLLLLLLRILSTLQVGGSSDLEYDLTRVHSGKYFEEEIKGLAASSGCSEKKIRRIHMIGELTLVAREGGRAGGRREGGGRGGRAGGEGGREGGEGREGEGEGGEGGRGEGGRGGGGREGGRAGGREGGRDGGGGGGGREGGREGRGGRGRGEGGEGGRGEGRGEGRGGREGDAECSLLSSLLQEGCVFYVWSQCHCYSRWSSPATPSPGLGCGW